VANTITLRATLDRIERDPESWDQSYYGVYVGERVRYCYAGHAAILAGDPPSVSRITPELSVFTVSGRFIWHVAREYLDLTWEQMYGISRPYNSLDDVRRLVAEFIAEEEQSVASTIIASVRR
jgi:hypothetical protein